MWENDEGFTMTDENINQAGQTEQFDDATAVAGSGEAMIRVIEVDKFFGDFQALRNINMNVGRQEVVVGIGPSVGTGV